MLKFGVFVVVVLLSGLLRAQSPLGTVTGVATDATGAPVPSATVTLVNQETGVTTESVTNTEGVFNIPNLRPGSYKLSASAKGMRPFETPVFPVAAFRTVRQDLRFEVQAAATEVTISDTVATIIQTESPAISNTLSSRQIIELPTNLRSVYNNSGDSSLIFVMMPLTVPGVVQVGAGAAWVTPGAGANGVRLRVDGIDTTFGNFGGPDPVSQPSFESIEEFTANILTTKAEFAGQGQITSVTRGGTNEYHGSLFWYLRNSALDATNPFLNTKTFQNIHNFGGSIGGPIKKDRTFFFANFDSTRGVRGYNFAANVPTLAQRQGDFSGAAIRNPLTGEAFAGARIPGDMISPQAKAIQDLFFPLPNFGSPTATAGNYRATLNGPETHNIFEARVDHNFTSGHSLFGRYQYKDSEYEIPGARTQLPTAGTSQNFRNVHFGTIGDVYAIRPNMYNEFRAGLVILESSSDADNRGQEILDHAGIGGLSQPGVQGIPNFNIAGLTGIGQLLLNPVIDGHWQISDSLSWVTGKHSMKFGFEHINWFVNRYLPVTATRFGNFAFTNRFSGHAYADFLLGYPTNVVREAPYPVQYNRFQDWSFFAQDDWKLTQRLTLSLGLRYEYNGPAKPRDGNMYNFDAASGSVIVPSDESRRLFAEGFPSTVPIITADSLGLSKSLRRADKNNFGPRFGMSYMLTDKTVIRGGWGLYYGHFSAAIPAALVAGPYAVSTTANSGDAQGRPTFSLANPYAAPGTLGSINVSGVSPDLQNAVTMQYSLSLERQFGDIGVRVSYIGSRGRQLPYRRNINQPPASTLPLTPARRPYPLYNTIDYADNGANSSYDGLQTQVSKRFSRGLLFSSTWTWAKAISEVDDTGNAELNTLIENAYDRRRDRGDVYAIPRHNWQNNLLYELPFGNHPVFGGWQLNALLNLSTGNFLNPLWAGADPTNTGLASFRPDVIREIAYPESQEQWYDRGAFQAPAPGTFGSAARNSVVGPGYVIFNLGAAKSFRMERYGTFQLGGSVQNVLNHTNYGQPNMTVNNANGGTITSTHIFAPAGSPRSGQLSLRYTF
jgi:Carboxypeptidase regulatory-like domain/TonB dependent receptor